MINTGNQTKFKPIQVSLDVIQACSYEYKVCFEKKTLLQDISITKGVVEL